MSRRLRLVLAWTLAVAPWAGAGDGAEGGANTLLPAGVDGDGAEDQAAVRAGVSASRRQGRASGGRSERRR